MSPRFDHRPPFVAFLFLVLVAVAVIGSSARAVDGHFFQAGPVEGTAHVYGFAPRSVAAAAERAAAPSRSATRAAPGPADKPAAQKMLKAERRAEKQVRRGVKAAAKTAGRELTRLQDASRQAAKKQPSLKS